MSICNGTWAVSDVWTYGLSWVGVALIAFVGFGVFAIGLHQKAIEAGLEDEEEEEETAK